MDILLGLGVLSASTLLFAAGFAAHRRPVPARWTRLPGLSMLFCVTLTMMAPVGLGFLVKAALTPQTFTAGTVMWFLPVAALAAAALVFTPVLIRSVRKAGTAPVAPASQPLAVEPGLAA